ncbi:MAG TPA: transposase, partial [Bradyrhizobium sp.]|nr:transposase [Bradyrhizobium sp.]
LIEVPGIGPVIATVVVATVPDEHRFSSARHFAAWLGLTPKQHSSGGKERLLGISKRGDAYMRRQFINGARSLVRIASGRTGGYWDWINALLARRAFNVVTVAVANKLARVAWALQSHGTRWQAA